MYQENVYSGPPFVSARKVLKEMGAPYDKSLEMVSFHTTSKGAWGECGLRGGYFELLNVDPETADELYKLASVNLSPGQVGQVRRGSLRGLGGRGVLHRLAARHPLKNHSSRPVAKVTITYRRPLCRLPPPFPCPPVPCHALRWPRAS